MNRVAVVCPKGQYTYEDLLHYSSDLADDIRQLSKRIYPNADEQFPLKGENVAFLCGNNMSWVVTLLAVWMCGGVAVPLCKSHPVSELEYFITDCGAKLVISSKKYESQLSAITSQHSLEHKVGNVPFECWVISKIDLKCRLLLKTLKISCFYAPKTFVLEA